MRDCSHNEKRPLDPGYTSQAKLVLATTKDRDHRIYLRDGIFADDSHLCPKALEHRWSYPTYRGTEVAGLLKSAGNIYGITSSPSDSFASEKPVHSHPGEIATGI